LNCLARCLPESLRCHDEILFWGLYLVLCLGKSCHILPKGGRVKRDTNQPQIVLHCQRHTQMLQVSLWSGSSELVFAVDSTKFVVGSSSISNVFAKLLHLLDNFFAQESHAYNKSVWWSRI